jgi:dihydroorotase
MPAQAESVMVWRDVELAELTGGRLHVQHLSAAGSVRAVREAKRRGLRVTAEATPHHLALTDEDLARAGYDTAWKMCPPLRSAKDVAAVQDALADGTIDCIATDHAPHSPVEKDVEFDQAMNGIVGLETAFAVCLGLVRLGKLAEKRLIEALTAAPARVFALPGGTLRPGSPADLAVLDPAATWKVEPDRFFSKGRYSPWKGRELTGRCVATLVAGVLVHHLPGRGGR